MTLSLLFYSSKPLLLTDWFAGRDDWNRDIFIGERVRHATPRHDISSSSSSCFVSLQTVCLREEIILEGDSSHRVIYWPQTPPLSSTRPKCNVETKWRIHFFFLKPAVRLPARLLACMHVCLPACFMWLLIERSVALIVLITILTFLHANHDQKLTIVRLSPFLDPHSFFRSFSFITSGHRIKTTRHLWPEK